MAWRPSRLAAAFAALAFCLPGRLAAQSLPLLLEVFVNERALNKVGTFELRDGALFVRPDEWRDLGFRLPPGILPGEDGMLRLADIRGVTHRLDMAAQALRVTAPNNLLLPELIRAGLGKVAGARDHVPVDTGTGLALDYDLSSTVAGRQHLAGGLLDLRAFSPLGVVSSTALAYMKAASVRAPTVRLDTTYVYSDPDSLWRYRVGDFISLGPRWSRPTRLGGMQIASDFSLRPDLVTFPLPVVGGSATVPSTVDVLLNGSRLFSRSLQPGPFQLTQLPVVTGASTVTMNLTDALGRQVAVTLPFYASDRLLAAGLYSYSAEVGLIRRAWGVRSSDYGDAAGTFTYMRGLADWLTVESHIEASGPLRLAGGGIVVNLFNQGLFHAAAAGSQALGRSGWQVALGAQRIGPRFSLGVTANLASRDFRDLAAIDGTPVPSRQIAATMGLSLGAFGSLGLAYAEVRRERAPPPERFFLPADTIWSEDGPGLSTVGVFQPAQRAQVLTASYTTRFDPVSIFATGFHDFANRGGSGFLVGLSIPFGDRTSVAASTGGGQGRTLAQLQAMRSAPDIGDWGYRVAASGLDPYGAFAEAQYHASWAFLSVGADRMGGQTAYRATVRGSLAFADGGLFAGNSIGDSFAIVDTAGTPGVRVTRDNRPAGRTDDSGRLMVPNLLSFQANRIAIDPADLPIDALVPVTEREVRPQYRNGVVVRFPATPARAALLRLIDDAGQPVPLGSVATLEPGGSPSPVGHDGEAFLVGLGERDNQVRVRRRDGTACLARFDYRPVPGSIPRIDPLACREAAP